MIVLNLILNTPLFFCTCLLFPVLVVDSPRVYLSNVKAKVSMPGPFSVFVSVDFVVGVVGKKFYYWCWDFGGFFLYLLLVSCARGLILCSN